MENAFVFPLNGHVDPRAPSAPVPADVKWLNDELDDLPSLGTCYPGVALAAQANASHLQTVAELRTISPKDVGRAVKLAAQESTAKHADEWDNTEAKALEHLVHTLSIVSLGAPLAAVGADAAHATMVMANQTIDIIAIRGTSHENCLKHFEKHYVPLPHRQVLIITRDPDNNPWRQRLRSYLQSETVRLGQERKITEPDSGCLHLGYRELLDIFQKSTTVGGVQGAINAELAA